jgi:uncharacterized SAM-binding protein YcdF (DUF218 family)
MFFTASKILWVIFVPSHIILWCAVLAAALLLAGRRRAGTGFAVVSALLLLGIGLMPSHNWLGRPLEYRFEVHNPPTHADGILVLGGGSSDLYRLPVTAMLARRYPEARIVFSSGSAALVDNQPSVDAENAKAFLTALGVAPSRITLEGHSRNTFENLQFSKALVKPQPGQTWILVTSAYHLPRTMEIANQIGWKLFPWPANHLSAPSGMPGWWGVPANLDAFDTLLHEYIGLVVYRWKGYSRQE